MRDPWGELWWVLGSIEAIGTGKWFPVSGTGDHTTRLQIDINLAEIGSALARTLGTSATRSP
jgi:hypothetical protein